VTGGTEAEGFPAETSPLVMPADEFAALETVRDAVNGTRYEDGWRDCALSLAAEFDRRADRPGPAVAIGAVIGAAEVARRYAQNGPGARASAGPVSPDPGDGTSALGAAPDTIPMFDLPPEGSTK
jgi:hypothetical protein